MHESDPDLTRLPLAEFAFPGPLRDRLVAAILDGSKVSTTALAIEYEIENEPLPPLGQRSVVIDSLHRPVAVIELKSIVVVPLDEVDLAHAIDEGEGFTTLPAWRAAHESYWHSDEVRGALGEPDFTVDDSTPVVLERFTLVERLD